ncbi:hypothetical protein EJ06DRAFT_93299 [Trichodelitschia bisporula]|uniref:Uncharacterized protein n=1 Tax=Trichodelitschia bisporula TaxID=703511 RepID=A0A6G1HSG4_9PEZI|nr:hypothetical protein EJ06DRAFT_93299 [Trichodelitschia bisporula]
MLRHAAAEKAKTSSLSVMAVGAGAVFNSQLRSIPSPLNIIARRWMCTAVTMYCPLGVQSGSAAALIHGERWEEGGGHECHNPTSSLEPRTKRAPTVNSQNTIITIHRHARTVASSAGPRYREQSLCPQPIVRHPSSRHPRPPLKPTWNARQPPSANHPLHPRATRKYRSRARPQIC